MFRFLLSRLGLTARPAVGMFARDLNTGRVGMLTDSVGCEFKMILVTNEAAVTEACRTGNFAIVSDMTVRPIKLRGSYYFDWNKVA